MLSRNGPKVGANVRHRHTQIPIQEHALNRFPYQEEAQQFDIASEIINEKQNANDEQLGRIT